MTHKTRECIERPRKRGAKWSKRDFAQDEVVENVEFNFEAKRDRWNGYDSKNYQKNIEEWNEREALKKTEDKPADSDSDIEKLSELSSDSDINDKDIIKNPRAHNLTREERTRHDTAKYLVNLEIDSSHYDGKSRAMRGNPNEKKEDDTTKVNYDGDNQRIYTGQYLELME